HAIAEYAARGMPEGAAVALSADKAIPADQFPAALRYFQGSADTAGHTYLNATYGEQALIAFLKQEGAIQVGWRSRSTAWPGGSSSAYCDLLQTGSTTLDGVEIDVDEALIPFFGQWMPGKLAPKGADVELTDIVIGPNGRPGGNSVGNILTDVGRLRDALAGDSTALTAYAQDSPLRALLTAAAEIPALKAKVDAL